MYSKKETIEVLKQLIDDIENNRLVEFRCEVEYRPVFDGFNRYVELDENWVESVTLRYSKLVVSEKK